MDGCRRNRTQTSSQMSGLPGDESAEFAERDLPVTESMSTEWTNEKHSLYLKSMETSFVKQLYNSMDLLGWRSEKALSDPKLSQQHCSPCTPSGQFKVHRHGCWQKINFQKQSQLSIENESCGFLTSPWIQHFRSARKSQVVPSSTPLESAGYQCKSTNFSGRKTMSCGSATSFHQHYSCSCHHDLADTRIEVSDQNFVDEDIEDWKAGNTCSSKRVKTTDAPSNDQAVPYGKPAVTDDVAEKCHSPATCL